MGRDDNLLFLMKDFARDAKEGSQKMTPQGPQYHLKVSKKFGLIS